ncbi:MAG TPA: DUF3892 domain-containing protein [Candidatus Saccharimonadales bacterium]|nr:DUF3892 domain-containing protein [Candidatus Saccharimonadales bacterium]
MVIRIVCINKDNGNHANPHEGITRFGWVYNGPNGPSTGYYSRTEMVAYLERNNQAYVSNHGKTVYCFVNVSREGNKFVQTRADSDWSDNLLALGEC